MPASPTNYSNTDARLSDFEDRLEAFGDGQKLEIIRTALLADVAKVGGFVIDNSPGSGNPVDITVKDGKTLSVLEATVPADLTGPVDVLLFGSSAADRTLTLNLNASQAAELDLILFDQLPSIVPDDTGDVTLTVSAAAFRGAVVLGAGDDKAVFTSTRGVQVDGGDGDDSIVTGTGRDTVVIGAGDDTVLTGAGNDTIVFANTWFGSASVNAGLGTDVLDLRGISFEDTSSTFGQIESVTQASGVLSIQFKDGSTISASNIEAILYQDDGGLAKVVGVAKFIEDYPPNPS